MFVKCVDWSMGNLQDCMCISIVYVLYSTCMYMLIILVPVIGFDEKKYPNNPSIDNAMIH